MPEIADPPPGVQPVKKSVIEPGSVVARSMADEFAAGKPPVEPEPKGSAPKPDFTTSLAAAQAKDKGAPTPKVEAEEPPPAKVDTDKPASKVPGLPPPEEWRPKGEKASVQWDQMKARHADEMSAARTELDRVRSELQSAKANGSPDAAALRKEAAELREILRDIAIERDPTFKASFEPREKAAMEAAELATGEHAAKLKTLLKAPGSQWRDEQLNELLEKLPASSQRRVNAALSVLEQIDVERSTAIAQSRATFDQKQAVLAQQRQSQQSQVQTKLMADFEATQKQWTDPKAGHPMFIEREGDKAHNEGVKESLELAKTIFSGELSSQEIATAAFWAASGERLLKGWHSAVARAEKAEKALDKLRGVQPGDGRVSELNGDDTEKMPAPGSPGYLSYMNARLQAAQRKDAGLAR